MIWDLHCHLSGVPGETPEQRVTQLLKFADRLGVERMCFYMGMNWARNPNPDDLKKQNDEVLQALSHWHDRLFGFTYVSGEHVEASLNEMERCIAKGPMVGIKLWVSKRCNAPELDPIIAKAASLKAVIFQHTWIKTDGGQLPGESTPGDLVELSKRHPNVPMICGHSGGTWELGLRTIRQHPLLYADLAGSDPVNGMVEMAVRELGPDRVLYGSDIGGRSFASQIAKVQGARIPQEFKTKIFRDNLKRLLQPILDAKGVKA